MKKLFVLALVAVTFAACGGAGTKEETSNSDTTTVVVPAAPDTVQVVTDTTVTVKTDTIAK
ncbi:MAG: hypothetical protein QM727_01735 [Niabella sp.]